MRNHMTNKTGMAAGLMRYTNIHLHKHMRTYLTANWVGAMQNVSKCYENV